MEIQIEGGAGWAKNLPTWKPSKKNFLVKLWGVILSGKELTGYHLSLFLLIILFFHFPYFFGVPLNLENWTRTLSLYFIFSVVEDFLWFVINPYFGIKKFTKELVTWHKNWIFGIPKDYYLGVFTSFVVLTPSFLKTPPANSIGWWFSNLLVLILLTILTFIIHLLIRRNINK